MLSKQFENSVSEHEVFETPNGSDIKNIQLGSYATRSDAEGIQFYKKRGIQHRSIKDMNLTLLNS